MTTLNAATITYTHKLASYVAECVGTGATLKSAKAEVTLAVSGASTLFPIVEGVDIEEVKECLWQAMDCRAKSDFVRRCHLLVETLDNMREELSKIARAHCAAILEDAERFPSDYHLQFERNEACRVARIEREAKAERIATAAGISPARAATLLIAVGNDEVKALNNATDETYKAQGVKALFAAQKRYTAAHEASYQALCDAADETGTEEAYDEAETKLEAVAVVLLQLAGRHAVALAGKTGKSISEINLLKDMFQPFFTGNYSNVAPGKRNQLINSALRLTV
jgi:hypothetical protein